MQFTGIFAIRILIKKPMQFFLLSNFFIKKNTQFTSDFAINRFYSLNAKLIKLLNAKFLAPLFTNKRLLV